MKYLVAVSGGIDSVVLLDMLARAGEHELVVAHFDHGIRDDSAADARFVEALAALYGVPYVGKREELGSTASEAMARARRYTFLKREAARHGAVIATAHHADDAVETIALNLRRGTGWRGLAVLERYGVARPLLAMTKAELRDYALKHRLEWVEDSTNATPAYTRNRLRRELGVILSSETRRRLLELWRQQSELRAKIDKELAGFLTADHTYSRYFFSQADHLAAEELLRAAVAQCSGQVPTRPQAERALLAIKTALPGAVFELGGRVQLRFAKRTFVVELAS